MLLSNQFSNHTRSYHGTKPMRGQELFIGCLFIRASHHEDLPLKPIPTFKGPSGSNLAHNHIFSWRKVGPARQEPTRRCLTALRYRCFLREMVPHLKITHLSDNEMFTVIIEDMVTSPIRNMRLMWCSRPLLGSGTTTWHLICRKEVLNAVN